MPQPQQPPIPAATIRWQRGVAALALAAVAACVLRRVDVKPRGTAGAPPPRVVNAQRMVPQTLALGPLPSAGGGSLSVSAYGDSRDELVLTVHGQNPALVNEWEETKIAQSLAERGFYVVCTNMHSNEKTKPGTLSPGGFAAVMDELLAVLQRDSCVLMGKSWGGRNAVAFAAARPKAVRRLVLSAPAFGMDPDADAPIIAKLSMPVLLGWSEDDTVIPYRTHEAYTNASGVNVQFASYASGGHMIIPEFGSAVLAFLGEPPAKL